jgi:hypothetical protein
MAGSRTASLFVEKTVKRRARILAHFKVARNISANYRNFGIFQRFATEETAELQNRISLSR